MVRLGVHVRQNMHSRLDSNNVVIYTSGKAGGIYDLIEKLENEIGVSANYNALPDDLE